MHRFFVSGSDSHDEVGASNCVRRHHSWPTAAFVVAVAGVLITRASCRNRYDISSVAGEFLLKIA